MTATTTATIGLVDGKAAFVSGGSRGLGRAICEVLAREGADVAFNYLSNDAEAQETVRRIEAHGRRALAKKVSVLDRAGLEAFAKQAEETLGHVDVVVNSAGVGQVVPLALMEEEDWDRVMDTNVKGAFLVSRAFLRGMVKRRHGRILNVSSLAGVKMLQAPVHYSTAKAALKGFTESLAKEIGRYGITVNCIAPGILDEGVAHRVPDDKLREYVKNCALGRVGTCLEVAEVVAFLVSDRNSYMSGATVVVDGAV